MLKTLVLITGLFLALALLPTAWPGSLSAARLATCTELVVDGGFEAGGTGWTSHSNGVPPRVLIDAFYPYSGDQGAILAGVDDAVDQLAQQVRLPGDASEIRLAFWWALFTEEAPGGAFDDLRVQLFEPGVTDPLTTTLTVTNDSAESLLWNPATADLTLFAGQTVELRFTGTTDHNRPTAFYFDDVSVLACVAGTATATPTATPPDALTLTATPTATDTATSTATLTPTPTLTATATASPTVTRGARVYLPIILR